MPEQPINVRVQTSGVGCFGGCALLLAVIVPVGLIARFVAEAPTWVITTVVLAVVAMAGTVMVWFAQSIRGPAPTAAAAAEDATRKAVRSRARIVNGTCTWCRGAPHPTGPQMWHAVEIEAAVRQAHPEPGRPDPD